MCSKCLSLGKNILPKYSLWECAQIPYIHMTQMWTSVRAIYKANFHFSSRACRYAIGVKGH